MMTKQEVNKIINTIILTLEHKKDQFVDDMKKILGDDLFDESLLKETTEPIYEYIVEKIYQTPGYIEEEPFKNKRKLKIDLINFMPNIELKSKKLRYRDVKTSK